MQMNKYEVAQEESLALNFSLLLEEKSIFLGKFEQEEFSTALNFS